jgi:hypothetical protein
MQDPMIRQGAISVAWKQAWSNKRFRTLTVGASILLLVILICLPLFFHHIEQRHGVVLQDRLLELIPPTDVSIPTFVIIWSMTLFMWLRCIQDPSIFIVFLVCFILLMLSRMISISLVPLDPPPGLIPLKDPLSNIFYGGTNVFVTRDLFYSGHTSIQLMMFFSFRKKLDKLLALVSTFAIASFVLIQHVHYTIDVAAAFVFSYFIYLLGKRIARY